MSAREDADGRLIAVTRIFSREFGTTGMLGASQIDGQWRERGFPTWMTVPGRDG